MPRIVDVGNLCKAELTILASEWLPGLLGDNKRYALLEGLCGEELRFNDKQPSAVDISPCTVAVLRFEHVINRTSLTGQRTRLTQEVWAEKQHDHCCQQGR